MVDARRAEESALAVLVVTGLRPALVLGGCQNKLSGQLGVITYNPAAGGLLSGKHSRSAPPSEGTRFTLGTAGGMYQERYWHEREFGTVDELGQVAEQAGINLVTLSVAWVLAHPAVTAPIIGASRPDQLQASLAAAELVLDGDLKRRLDELTHPYRMGEAPR